MDIKINNIYNIPCEEGIDLMVDQGLKVDCIITSPPYNLDISYDLYQDKKPFDEYIKWLDHIFDSCRFILKEGASVCINIGDQKNGSIPTHAYIINFMLQMDYKMISTIIWNKNHTSNRASWGSWLSPSCPSFPCTFEYILIFRYKNKVHKGDKKNITVNKNEFVKNSNSIWNINPSDQKDHPAQFPKEIPYRLIQQLTYRNDIVLDIFSGTGTTCEVAKSLNRKYLGFEISETYHKIALSKVNKFFE